MNSIMIIQPYKKSGIWMFDDINTGLKEEALIGGTDKILDYITREIPNAEQGFNLVFSATEFPDFQYKFDWAAGGEMGNYYYSKEFDMMGWLCPALFKYFADAPKELYVMVREKKEDTKLTTAIKCSEPVKGLYVADGPRVVAEEKNERHEEKMIPITWSDWDEISVGILQFYDVIFTRDWGPAKKDERYDTLVVNLEDCVIETYKSIGCPPKDSKRVWTTEIRVEPVPL